jgi:hypothetical protein
VFVFTESIIFSIPFWWVDGRYAHQGDIAPAKPPATNMPKLTPISD